MPEPKNYKYVIIGDGIAGHTAAKTIREEEPEADILIISKENIPVYNRIRLKKYTKGEADKDSLSIFDQKDYKELNIQIKLNTKVERVDTANKRVYSSERSWGYKKLLIASGGTPYDLPVSGAELNGVHKLWNMRDADNLLKEIKKKKNQKAVVIGGGYLGINLAEIFVSHGLETKYLIREDQWGSGIINKAGAKTVENTMKEKGVKLKKNEEVSEIKGSNKVEKVLTGKNSYQADLVGVAIGLDTVPNFIDKNIEVETGVITDEYLKTNAEDVYAAGDVAEFYDPILEERVQNGDWYSAEKQGEIAGLNMVGREKKFKYVDFTTLNRFGLFLYTIGHPKKDGGEVIYSKGDQEKSYRELTLLENKLVGATLIEGGKSIPQIKKLIKKRKSIKGKKEDLLDGTYNFN